MEQTEIEVTVPLKVIQNLICLREIPLNIVYSLQQTYCLILDFASVSSIDPAGSGALKKVVTEFKEIDIAVYSAGILGELSQYFCILWR
jgi:anti-anti-sigma regulatory factor